jgi:hypothetical protein
MVDAWDATQVASVDIVTAAKWNDMVIDQKARAPTANPVFTGTATFNIIAASGAISGSNLSGTNTGDLSRLTEVSTTIAHATSDAGTGKTFSVNLLTGYGQIARLRLYTDYVAGWQTTSMGLVNNASGITDTATQIVYDGGTGTATLVANDYINVDGEIMLVTANTGTTSGTLNVTRAQKGTKGATHDDNATILKCNDGVRIEIYPNSALNSYERILRWDTNYTGVWTTDQATTANQCNLTFTTRPATLPDFGNGDVIYISDTASSEYCTVQAVYGDVAGTLYDDSITTQATLQFAHAITKSVYRVCELLIPIPYKLPTGTTLYGVMYVDEKISGTVNATLMILYDKWGA